MSYFNNHNHTEYSNALLGFPDVICRVGDLIQRAYDLGLSGITITEHEGISSHIQALNYYKSMDKNRPFVLALGNEIHLMEEKEDLTNKEDLNTYPYYHFILTALDTEGHKQLRELSTRAWIRAWKQDKMFRRATYYTDLEEIVRPNQGHIVASTACLGSRLDKLLLKNSIKEADNEVKRLIDILGKNNFYIECQPADSVDTDQSQVNKLLWQIANRHSLKIIPTTDTHYLKKEDRPIHEAYLKSQEGEREIGDFYSTTYLMDENELRKHLLVDFNNEQIDQMFKWSNELGQRIKGYNIKHKPIIPQIPIDKLPNSFTINHWFKEYYGRYPNFEYYAIGESCNDWEDYFFYQIEQSLQSKIVDKGKDIEKYIARLDEEWKELRIISEQLDTSMASYYSTMSKIIDLIWEAGSLAMPARGSAAGFLTCYLLEVTQIDPVPLGDYMPSWRHLNHQRGVELPDIDNDSEASKKKAIVNKMKEYFGEDKVLNVATFSKISSKTAIERACKGLNISSDEAGYLKSLVPVSRGKVAKLKDCVFGNKEKSITPVYELVSELNKYKNLKETCLALEGLITNRGTHAAGVVCSNEPYTQYISAIRSADGTLETCYDLWDSEEAGLIKFDMLTVQAADKLHKTMDFLLENKKITWEGSLKATYYKWVHPDVLEYKKADMWDILPSIYSVFQFDTPISVKALEATKPHSVMDLSAANSLLRLMPDDADETPIDRYKRYKEKHETWVQDTIKFGLNDNERTCLWEYLSDAYGMADSQEKIMRLSMDKRVSGYSLKEANKLRKSIAKKDEKLQEESREMFYEYGEKLGTRKIFLDYIWNVVFAASRGYSFSQLHSYSYSIIALQELNLNYFYPRVYWNCACLSVEASGKKDENKDTATKDYSEVAKAIYKMKQSNIDVSPPSVNFSNSDFTPKEDTNTILFGLGGISGVNAEIASQILSNRPYSSFRDFYSRNSYQGSLITTSKFLQLIKAGCFDEFEPNRLKVMKKYITLSTETKQSLTTANLPEALKIGAKPPKSLLVPYSFKKYVCSPEFFYGNHPNFKSKKLYWLDEKAMKYFNANLRNNLQEEVDWWVDNETEKTIIVDKALDKFYKATFNNLKEYINTPEFIKQFNRCQYRARLNDLVPNQDENHWSFEALSYYDREHELACIDKTKYMITEFDKIPKEPEFITKSYGKRSWRQYRLYRIAGTCIAKNDSHHTITLLDINNNVIQVKMDGSFYAHMKRQISIPDGKGGKTVMDKSWLTRGTCLLVSGYRQDDTTFKVKTYKSSLFQKKIQKIEYIDKETGEVELLNNRYGFGDDEE